MKQLFALFLLPAFAASQAPAEFDTCPAAVQELAGTLRTQQGLDGIQIAYATNGRLACAGALGYADASTQRAMTSGTLLRVGSISKTITAMAILKLYEDGKLGLDDKLVQHLRDLIPAAGVGDARWNAVTIRQMLQHSMGWDRAIGGEPAQNSIAISKALGIRGPATTSDVARWILQQKLHFDPGTKGSYTGVAYGLLSLLVERAGGLPYEQYVLEKVLEPMGIRTSMRVGRTLPEGRLYPEDARAAEGVYRSDPSLGLAVNVFPYLTNPAPRPYGEWYQEGLEGSGGWVATAPALVRFIDRVFGRSGIPAFFKAATLAELQARPGYESASATDWYGLGWQVIPVAAGYRYRFAGELRGTLSEVYYLPNGVSFAYIVNSTPADPNAGTAVSTAAFPVLSQQAAQAGDLFASAKYSDGAIGSPRVRAQRGVVHGASFEAGVTPGSWVTILGWNLATTTRLWTGADFQEDRLPTVLDGVEVKINGKAAAVYYISPTQINAQVPELAVTGTATLQVIRNGVASQPEPMEIRASSPEFFRYAAGGLNFVAAVHLNGSVVADPALIPGLRAAQAGETLQIFGTGFAVAPAGQVVTSVVPVAETVIRVGNQAARVSFSGLVGTGLFQANLTVPTLPPGDYPVSLSVGGVGSLALGVLPVR
ncbi:serine hydrolase [Bryobacter aggregatus]|uniref:serine hydrolase n=1 Tax=Bryobacter aggregatus TaxID=360054 RepID=UPI0004E1BE34|nr:serine hydrolase [Bryobacter aggregatus]